MNKRLFALCLGALMLTCSTQALAKEKVYKWKMALSWPSNLKPIAGSSVNFKNMVETMSNGRLKIKIHGAEKHKAPLGILDMVKAGNYEMGHSASYYWKGKDEYMPLFTSVPFMFTIDELQGWFYHGGGMELMDEAYKKHKVYSLPGGNTGVQMGGWFKKEIKTVEDLKGLKMRTPGYAGEIYSKLGAVVTNIPVGELYTSLDRGTIDALEWVGPDMDMQMGFHKITPYYYTGWHEPASDNQFLINRKAFDKLPKDLQAIIKVAAQATAARMYNEIYHKNAQALLKIQKEYPNIKIKEFPLPVLKAMKKVKNQLMDELEAKGGLTAKIVKSQREYLKKIRPWSDISIFTYLKNMKALED